MGMNLLLSGETRLSVVDEDDGETRTKRENNEDKMGGRCVQKTFKTDGRRKICTHEGGGRMIGGSAGRLLVLHTVGSQQQHLLAFQLESFFHPSGKGVPMAACP